MDGRDAGVKTLASSEAGVSSQGREPESSSLSREGLHGLGESPKPEPLEKEGVSFGREPSG